MNSSIKTVSREIKKEIMSTDIYVEIQSSDYPEHVLEADLNKSFTFFKDFESSYSRFIPGNELYRFNRSGGEVSVGEDLHQMLMLSKEYNIKTQGLFNPAILPLLIKEGYSISLNSKNASDYPVATTPLTDFGLIEVMPDNVIRKPPGVMVDLGGIGKGYVVDKVATFLSRKYKNFVVDAGGDIYFSGKDVKNNSDCWYSEVLHPMNEQTSLVMLKISNMGIATSGVNKRKWVMGSGEKNHIIDPFTKTSTSSDILTATVISESTVKSDVFAKTSVLLGSDQAVSFCEKNDLVCYIVRKDMEIRISPGFSRYVDI